MLGLAFLAILLIAALRYYQLYGAALRSALTNLSALTLEENRSELHFSLYMREFLVALSLNPATSQYDLQEAIKKSWASGADAFQRALYHWHEGDFRQAIELIEEDVEKNGRHEENLFWLAMAYLRYAEALNCLPQGGTSEHLLHGSPVSLLLKPDEAETSTAPHKGPSRADHALMCSLPLLMPHQRQAYSRKSAELFEELLDQYGAENRLYRWLLNFAYMTVGGYPDEVPSRYLVRNEFTDFFYGPDAASPSVQPFPLSFRESARQLNIATMNAGKGVAVEDFDRDGDLDLVTGGNFDLLHYYRNEGGRTFSDRTSEAGLENITQPHIISAADYDNDGWMDLFVGRPFHHFQLFRNRADGTFEDTTFSSGLLEPGSVRESTNFTWVSAWSDVDRDGDLDLFVCSYGQRAPVGVFDRPSLDSTLYINLGGRFIDGTEDYGLSQFVEDQNFAAAAFGDFDQDGYPDLFLSSTTAKTSLMLKNRNGSRFEAFNPLGEGVFQPGFMTAFLDIDHDGRLDLFQGGTSLADQAVAMTVFGENLDRYARGFSVIYRQQPDGSFKEERDFFRPAMPMATMGASFGDINNDGCYEFYLGTGNPEGWFILPNLLFGGLQSGKGCKMSSRNISMLEGFATIQKGHGIVFFDFDNDGDQDIYSSLGGMWPADRWPNQFFVNESPVQNSWIKIRLRGRQSNYYGVGARIKIIAESLKGEQIVRYYHMTNKTGFGSAPYLAHIGLLDAVRIRQAVVAWPNSSPQAYPARIGRLNILDEAGSAAEE